MMDKETKEFCKKHDVVAQYHAGFDAQREGKYNNDAPYPVGSHKHTAWVIGHEDAENDIGE